ncbi:hypothetical protein B0F90DRAFT_1223653 [Multifurca ochricompacta]|uniref:Uncharacterized protein n=1 Tax=Multifurca ochricompacta TaxID=376703 RepID=A0AAD4LY60_9AGAM|nr:hypothetical protein B0F90DRAFT_1223653 [Multifurca ochricompacta]
MAIVYQRTGPSKLQFYQFSTGSQHPSAAIHCLEFDQLSTARVTCVECCGDTIIVVIRDGQIGEERGDYIFFVDWRIGRIVQLRKAQLGTYGTLVTFLSSDAILLARRDTFTLELCSLNGIVEMRTRNRRNTFISALIVIGEKPPGIPEWFPWNVPIQKQS